MATKDISDIQVCQAVREAWAIPVEDRPFDDEHLARCTGQPQKVCYRALERAVRRGLLDYGVSLRTSWLTDKGMEELRNHEAERELDRLVGFSALFPDDEGAKHDVDT